MTWKPWQLALVIAAFLPPMGGGAWAQHVDLDATLNQSFTSVESLGSPTGFRLGVHLPSLWGPFGARAGFSSVREGDGQIAGYCGAFSCVTGPFDSAYYLRSLAVGASYLVPTGSWAEVSVGLSVSYSWQYRRLEHLDTGEVSRSNSVGPDLGIGAFGDVRLRPIALGLMPVAYLQYDRIRATECVEDGTCFGGRNLFALGIGLGWRVP